MGLWDSIKNTASDVGGWASDAGSWAVDQAKNTGGAIAELYVDPIGTIMGDDEGPGVLGTGQGSTDKVSLDPLIQSTAATNTQLAAQFGNYDALNTEAGRLSDKAGVMAAAAGQRNAPTANSATLAPAQTINAATAQTTQARAPAPVQGQTMTSAQMQAVTAGGPAQATFSNLAPTAQGTAATSQAANVGRTATVAPTTLGQMSTIDPNANKGQIATIAPTQNVARVNVAPAAQMNSAQIAPLSQMDAADIGRQDEQFRTQQATLSQLLEQSAQGQGPSVAEGTLNRAMSRNLTDRMAAAASSRGSQNIGLINRQLDQGQSSANFLAAQEAAQNKIKETLSAREQLAGVTQGARAADIQVNTAQAQLIQDQRRANMEALNTGKMTQAQFDQEEARLNQAATNAQIEQQANINQQSAITNAQATNQRATDQANLAQQAYLQDQRTIQESLIANQNALNNGTITQAQFNQEKAKLDAAAFNATNQLNAQMRQQTSLANAENTQQTSLANAQMTNQQAAIQQAQQNQFALETAQRIDQMKQFNASLSQEKARLDAAAENAARTNNQAELNKILMQRQEIETQVALNNAAMQNETAKFNATQTQNSSIFNATSTNEAAARQAAMQQEANLANLSADVSSQANRDKYVSTLLGLEQSGLQTQGNLLGNQVDTTQQQQLNNQNLYQLLTNYDLGAEGLQQDYYQGAADNRTSMVNTVVGGVLN